MPDHTFQLFISLHGLKRVKDCFDSKSYRCPRRRNGNNPALSAVCDSARSILVPTLASGVHADSAKFNATSNLFELHEHQQKSIALHGKTPLNFVSPSRTPKESDLNSLDIYGIGKSVKIQ